MLGARALMWFAVAAVSLVVSLGCAVGGDPEAPPPDVAITTSDTPTPTATVTPTATAAIALNAAERGTAFKAAHTATTPRVRPERSLAPVKRPSPTAPAVTQRPVATPTPVATQRAAATPAPPVASPAPTQPSAPPTAVPRTTIQLEGGVTAIGDSVMLGAASALSAAVGQVTVDAEVSRHVAGVTERVRGHLASGALGTAVVIHTGNNGPMTARQFDDLMQLVGDRSPVVFVNVSLPRDWETGNNAVIRQGVARYSNTRLVDWFSASSGVAAYFGPDRIHLTPEGARAYASLIAGALDGP